MRGQARNLVSFSTFLVLFNCFKLFLVLSNLYLLSFCWVFFGLGKFSLLLLYVPGLVSRWFSSVSVSFLYCCRFSDARVSFGRIKNPKPSTLEALNTVRNHSLGYQCRSSLITLLWTTHSSTSSTLSINLFLLHATRSHGFT